MFKFEISKLAASLHRNFRFRCLDLDHNATLPRVWPVDFADSNARVSVASTKTTTLSRVQRVGFADSSVRVSVAST